MSRHQFSECFVRQSFIVKVMIVDLVEEGRIAAASLLSDFFGNRIASDVRYSGFEADHIHIKVRHSPSRDFDQISQFSQHLDPSHYFPLCSLNLTIAVPSQFLPSRIPRR
jgi:hypothetical protein